MQSLAMVREAFLELGKKADRGLLHQTALRPVSQSTHSWLKNKTIGRRCMGWENALREDETGPDPSFVLIMRWRNDAKWIVFCATLPYIFFSFACIFHVLFARKAVPRGRDPCLFF